MNILVTGASGQLGTSLRANSPKFKQGNFTFADERILDITRKNKVDVFLGRRRFDYIVNCAAYTDVDRAEREKEKARKVNVEGSKNLADAALKSGAVLIHLSTVYVFDGKSNVPYSEADAPCPLSIYGKTKFAGERAIRQTMCRTVIIRTSWLYSHFLFLREGKNFVRSIMQLGKKKKVLRIVADQIGAPTYVEDLTNAILAVIENTGNKKKVIRSPLLYHFSNEGVASWYDFAKTIVSVKNLPCQVEPISTREYPTPAPRPANSLLNTSKIKSDFAIKIPYWRDSLEKCLASL